MQTQYNVGTTIAKGATPAAVIVAGGNLLHVVAEKAGVQIDTETALYIVTGFYSFFRMLTNWLKNRKKSGY